MMGEPVEPSGSEAVGAEHLGGSTLVSEAVLAEELVRRYER